jgi:NTE family protein
MNTFCRRISPLWLLLFILTVNQVATAHPQKTLKQLQDRSLSIGLALSGGAAKGLAHIGVIKALEEAGIQVDFIAGSSMGALVGAAYAAGVSIDTLEKIAVESDWKTVSKLFVPGLSPSGFIDGVKVKEFLSTLYGDKKIEDLPIPFCATAADIATGRLYIINKGSLLEAVRASISIPIVFTPVKYKDVYLVDGGLVDPLPIDVVKEMGADYIIAVHVRHGRLPSEKGVHIQIEDQEPQTPGWKNTSEWIAKQVKMINNREKPEQKESTGADSKTKQPGLFKISENSVYIAQDVIAQLQIDLFQPDLVIAPDTRQINSYEFYRGRDAIAIGYNEAKKVLDALK